MIQETSGLSAAAYGALGAMFGAGVSAVVVAFNGWRQRKLDKELAEKRNRIQIREKIRETALTIALKEWESHLNFAKTKGCTVSSPDVYIFRYHQMLTLMEEGKLTKETIAQVQYDSFSVSNAVQVANEKYRKDKGLPMP
ncbi:hypothetical protein LEA60_18655 [Salmonella enterica]|uniref:hypothetical protein n=1 Tax=Salmonella sp. SAL04162 TaxID=3159782 RepID=UPI002A1B675D|nr:hypothetical protein [Salmonella enterica]